MEAEKILPSRYNIRNMAKKGIFDCTVVSNEALNPSCFTLRLHADGLPALRPGQFVEVRIDHTPTAFLRRPVSIHDVDSATGDFSLMIQKVGSGTLYLAGLKPGDTLNVLLPLGNGFSLPADGDRRPRLLVGGGVGVAPLLFLGRTLAAMGVPVTFLFGFRSKRDMPDLSAYEACGSVWVTTEDGSAGERGFVTDHSVLRTAPSVIQTCGPTPMMKSVARYAVSHGAECEVSLENKMACGLGACLCCVTETKEGHKCVCSEGPVFNISELTWQI